ncbi:MAG: hypothetical protein HQ546_06810 [Planctomycetes bacterium]|nr:hypothetical protein [Planctomycetota bacterium]
MIIRKAQMEAFSRAAENAFADRMVGHVNEFFPKRCAALGQDGTSEAIYYGIKRAKTYGIVIERDVCKYIDVMFAYGRDFDVDPKQAWAGRILNDPAIDDPAVRIKRLMAAAKQGSRDRG